jgi:hypothetical protein
MIVPSVCEVGQVLSEGGRVMSFGGDEAAPATVVGGGGGDHSWKLQSRDLSADCWISVSKSRPLARRRKL